MKVRVITDSTVDVAARYTPRIHVVPLTVRFGDSEYIDGVTIDKTTFYEKLMTCESLPTTSQGSPSAFEDAYRAAQDAGEAAIVITVSSKLSGTYQSACLAAQDFPNVRVIDSLNAATGSGVLAQMAVDMSEQGAQLDEIAETIEREKENVCLVAMLETLEYLKKGGRISRTVAFAGGILGLRPVVTIKDGAVSLIGSARGSKKANNYLMEKTKENPIDFSKPILLGYTGVTDDTLAQYIFDSRSLWAGKVEHLEQAQVSSAIGTHVGPGAIVVTYFKAKV